MQGVEREDECDEDTADDEREHGARGHHPALEGDASHARVQEPFDRRLEGVGIERFRRELRRACRDDVLTRLVPGGDHEHGHLPEMLVGTDACEHLEAAEPGQHEVEHHEVRLDLTRQLERGHAVACFREEIPVVERCANELAERRLVVADQNRLEVFHQRSYKFSIGLPRWPHERKEESTRTFKIARTGGR